MPNRDESPIRLAARAREERMREAVEELRRRLGTLQHTMAAIRARPPATDGAAAESE